MALGISVTSKPPSMHAQMSVVNTLIGFLGFIPKASVN
ncbi:hypothetical protein X770_30600 [Mesorhizobium sp. LSJC269B00]|nr:hypothetical protein X770_30600 [Mesorhizobium sp. LSJC269B00]